MKRVRRLLLWGACMLSLQATAQDKFYVGGDISVLQK